MISSPPSCAEAATTITQLAGMHRRPGWCRWLIALAILAVCLDPSAAAQGVATDGAAAEVVDVRTPDNWTSPYQVLGHISAHPEVGIRLHLRFEFRQWPDQCSGCRIKIFDDDNYSRNAIFEKEIDELKATGLTELWTHDLAARRVTIAVDAPVVPSGLQLAVTHFTPGSVRTERYESVVGTLDNRPVDHYRDQPNIYGSSLAVALLKFVGAEAGADGCSGFLVSARHLLTNYHCVSSQARCLSTSALFDLPSGPVSVLCKDYRGNEDLDVALLELAESVALVRPLKWLKGPVPSEPPPQFVVIHYPLGKEKEVDSSADCRMVENNIPNPPAEEPVAFAHGCDTSRGSSGAPILWQSSDQGMTVVGLHFSGCGIDRCPPHVFNKAMQGERIAAWAKANGLP